MEKPTQEFSLKTNDGLPLYASSWVPQSPRGLIFLVHGLGEHSGRYGHMIRFFNQAGLAVLTFDLRGHGKSGGPRGHTASFEALMDDIDLLVKKGEREWAGLPRFLYGHSLGGNLVLNYCLRRSPALSGVIASAPALRLTFTPSPIQNALARLTNRVYPGFTQSNGLDVKALSHDPAVISAYQNDPLVHDRISTSLFTGFFDSGAWALTQAGRFSLPLLIVHGTADAICDVQGSREFVEKAGPKASIQVWDGLYHEIHNEPQQQEVFDCVLAWVERILVQPDL